MNDADYTKILEKSIQKFIELVNEKGRIEDEQTRLQAFMYATMNLLSDDARTKFETKWQPYIDQMEVAIKSLTDSIRQVLQSTFPKWLTTANVRDQLRITGFDFSSYASNPLASISTTLRRLKDSEEIDFSEFDGVAAYRAKPPQSLPNPTGKTFSLKK